MKSILRHSGRVSKDKESRSRLPDLVSHRVHCVIKDRNNPNRDIFPCERISLSTAVSVPSNDNDCGESLFVFLAYFVAS